MSESENTEESKSKYRTPGNSTLQHAVQFAIVEDKPILMDYWTNSLDGLIVVGVRVNKDGTKEKLLVKSSDEYTSTILKFYTVGKEYIIITENSIYLTCSGLETKSIS